MKKVSFTPGGSLPNVCCCCMAPATTAFEVTYSKYEAVGGNKRRHTRAKLRVPVCGACEGHSKAYEKGATWGLADFIRVFFTLGLMYPLTKRYRLKKGKKLGQKLLHSGCRSETGESAVTIENAFGNTMFLACANDEWADLVQQSAQPAQLPA